MPPGDLRLCNNCYKQGHIAADCKNEKACNNCWKTGHLARDCPNDPICNMCNVSGHSLDSAQKPIPLESGEVVELAAAVIEILLVGTAISWVM